MSKPECTLLSHSLSFHLQQIYTGFYALYQRGLIDLKQQMVRQPAYNENCPQHLKDARNAHLRVVLNKGQRLYYDTHDSYEIDEEHLHDSDLYFKRSYMKRYLSKYGKDAEKIVPLGLYYRVYPGTFDKFAIQRNISLAHTLSAKLKLDYFINTFDIFNILRFTPRILLMESLPALNATPKIIFMVRAYDPYNDAARSKEKAEERQQLNIMRAACIKLLKKEFGTAFFGGFIHTDYAVENFKDLLLPTREISKKGKYIDLLKEFPIGVATTGLHGSIGGKFTEYVAFSKAIVSEKLNYEVPGNLQEGRNYLVFENPEECVHRAASLFDDNELRTYLMLNNAIYYQNYLRPDILILNTILKAMSLESHILDYSNLKDCADFIRRS